MGCVTVLRIIENNPEPSSAGSSKANGAEPPAERVHKMAHPSGSEIGRRRKQRTQKASCDGGPGGRTNTVTWIVFLVVVVLVGFWALPAHGAPSLAAKSWPSMKTYDIWGEPENPPSPSSGARSTDSFDPHAPRPADGNGTGSRGQQRSRYSYGEAASFYGDASHNTLSGDGGRQRSAKVLNFLPVPVNDECLADDGRRTGMCMNVYECRIQGGKARGECALGFGVCCVFVATCNEEIGNNLTYFVSPRFPGIVPKDVGSCKLKIKLMNTDVSQLKFEFIHFALGQPNRRTGVCEGDIFRLIGGVVPFDLCGHNSGQHLYYDLSPKSRADESIELEMNFATRSFAQRLWEIRVSQIPFSQRSPSGCMQYFIGTEGLIQTFNFAENGRYLANHNYRACIRQEKNMCSVAYEPCDEQSFRIGGSRDQPGAGGAGAGPLGGAAGGGSPASGTGPFSDPSLASDPLAPAADIPADVGAPVLESPVGGLPDGSPLAPDQDVAADDPTPVETAGDDPDAAADEGSGGGGGFFDGFFPSFFGRSIFDDDGDPSRSGRSLDRGTGQDLGRQFGTVNCADRITLPCIVEDFIGVGMGELPSCRPVHCGNSLCPPGVSPCRVETSVTPFSLGIHFGEGLDRGSPEDNLGACIRYSQIPCAG